VTILNTDHQQDAYDILQRNGAYDASSRMGQTSGASEEGQRMQLKEERLQATKEQVQTGEVVVHGDGEDVLPLLLTGCHHHHSLPVIKIEKK
jgi:Domain of unknown function (DUF2382)